MTLTILAIEGNIVRYEVHVPIEDGYMKIRATGRINEPIELNYH